ncbi:MAG TPA: hypothetical protein VM554_00760 [Acidisarcina sp.]|nr:hypothetical protein [Acidisarcina sp.]
MPANPEMQVTVRGTQSLVHTLHEVWMRPSLVALEVLWRWLFGAPALWLIYRGAVKILAAAPLESTGVQQLTLQDPWQAAALLSDAAAALIPLVLHAALSLVPLLAVGWAVASGLGRTLVLRRYDRSLPAAPLSMIFLQLLRVIALGAMFAGWFYGLHRVANATLSGPGEPNLLAYLVQVICLSLGLFTLWALASWIFSVAPLLVVLERRSALSSLHRSLHLGREFTGKLREVNLVMGIVKLALIVLAIVFSATPIPFEAQMSGDALHLWWLIVTLLYFVANDFFQVARLVSFIRFWKVLAARADGTQSMGV